MSDTRLVTFPTAPGPRIGDLAVVRLPEARSAVFVHLFENETFGDPQCPVSGPHRHEFYELVWAREGDCSHLIDDERRLQSANTLLLIGRRGVHQLERGQELSGAVVRFGDELLHDEPAARSVVGTLLAGTGVMSAEVPDGDTARVDAVVRTLAAEAGRSPEVHSVDIQRHLLMTLLSWTARWHDRDTPHGQGQTDLQLSRRFGELLERDFARHRDVSHYARQLNVSPATLWRVLSRVTGRSTRALITERVMTEAARLLRFTDLTVGEIATRVGIDDRLYLSRAFKRQYGEPPLDYRQHTRESPTLLKDPQASDTAW
ncbi:helix-turn-helix transcriptional regulator [Streptomyces sp. NPDC058464]|uniref:helix-turn-helix transcriptional regulator n=1 Tax=Streptomyces sp. NPDC058464 TaxID=3346511 RepID=UPI0036608183